MLNNVEGIKFKSEDKVQLKSEVRKYMDENSHKCPSVYEGDPHFTKGMYERVKDMAFLTIREVGEAIVLIEEESHEYDSRWFEYYSEILTEAEEF